MKRDILVFTDEEGQEIQMEILDYLNMTTNYTMLIEAEENHHGHDHECAIMTMKRNRCLYHEGNSRR